MWYEHILIPGETHRTSWPGRHGGHVAHLHVTHHCFDNEALHGEVRNLNRDKVLVAHVDEVLKRKTSVIFSSLKSHGALRASLSSWARTAGHVKAFHRLLHSIPKLCKTSCTTVTQQRVKYCCDATTTVCSECSFPLKKGGLEKNVKTFKDFLRPQLEQIYRGGHGGHEHPTKHGIVDDLTNHSTGFKVKNLVQEFELIVDFLWSTQTTHCVNFSLSI